MSNLTADELRELYILCKGDDCATISDLAKATGLSQGQVERGLKFLKQKKLVENSRSHIAHTQFETVK